MHTHKNVYCIQHALAGPEGLTRETFNLRQFVYVAIGYGLAPSPLFPIRQVTISQGKPTD